MIYLGRRDATPVHIRPGSYVPMKAKDKPETECAICMPPEEGAARETQEGVQAGKTACGSQCTANLASRMCSVCKAVGWALACSLRRSLQLPMWPTLPPHLRPLRERRSVLLIGQRGSKSQSVPDFEGFTQICTSRDRDSSYSNLESMPASDRMRPSCISPWHAWYFLTPARNLQYRDSLKLTLATHPLSASSGTGTSHTPRHQLQHGVPIVRNCACGLLKGGS